MMKIEIIVISKDKDSWVREISREYLARLSRSCDISFIVLKEESIGGDVQKVKIKEGQRIIDKLKDGYIWVALDVAGPMYDSLQFARAVESWRDHRGGKVQFIIGGPLGVSQHVLEMMHETISLSKMTFTHQMVRGMLLEQLYRAFEILKGSSYHK